jgi:phage tail sheath protein FI
MAVQVSYPGVYIDEFAPGAPIQGVGTGTAAFVGIAAIGDFDTPTKITSWESFKDTFGKFPVPGFYLWYAVRGFFVNGGQIAYVVRASNGTYEEAPILDRVGNEMIRVRARQPGDHGNQIEVTLRNELAKDDAELYRPTGKLASIVDRTVTMADEDSTLLAGVVAARFRPDDWITFDDAGERLRVMRVSGATLQLDSAPTVVPAVDATVQLADLPAGMQTVRLKYSPNNIWTEVPANTLVPGTALTLDVDGSAETHIVDSVRTEYSSEGTTYRVTFRDGLYAPMVLDGSVAVQSEEFDIVVNGQPYVSLSIDPAHPRHYLSVINQDPAGLVTLEAIEPPPPVSLPDSLPDTLSATSLTGGTAEDLSSMSDVDFIAALDTLEAIDDINIVSVPDSTSAAVQQAVIQHVEQLADRFAVLDSQPGMPLFSVGDGSSVEEHRKTLDSTRGYAALYYPWLRVSPNNSGGPILVPPSGHVCGIMARSDATRGVHKAPANEIVNGVLGLERSMSNIEQGQLNLQGINVIRSFAGRRPKLWGARTTATDSNWQYVNIRRLFLFLEESIQEGIEWAVFEPNNLQLWQKLRRTINEFLNRVWRDGGLFGATAEEAYYCRIDETLNPFSEQALGRLYIEIGVRPTYPAEFIVVRIGIWDGGSEVSEQ